MKFGDRMLHTTFRTRHFAFDRPLCRLGLATRGNTHLNIADVEYALDRGINFLNWCGVPDALSATIARLGPRRRDVLVCVQFEARTAEAARAELASLLDELRTDYVDVLTFYYVEEAHEWDEIAGPGGALEYCREAQRRGQVRVLGVTSHRRPLAAAMAQSGLLDLLMIRYNSAHRGAEKEIFPVTDAVAMPVVVYTCLRWGALLEGTPEDPQGFVVPRAPEWYRFALASPSVTVALMAPDTREELDEDLQVLAAGPLTVDEYDRLAAHGDRVRKHAGRFP
jgi:predicted aldo/keto reductase-like oxidoreductase